MRCKNEVEVDNMIWDCGTDIGFMKEEKILCKECAKLLQIQQRGK